MAATELRADERAKPVSEAIRWGMLAPLVAASCYTALVLVPFAGHTAFAFAWTMAPLTAWLLGSAYAGSAVMLVLALRRSEWADVRISAYSTSMFMVLMLAASLLGRHTMHLAHGPIIAFFGAWIWMLIHVAVLFVGAGVLIAQAFTRGRTTPRAPGPPLLIGGPMLFAATWLSALGIAVTAAPSWAVRNWPWTVSELDVRALGAWCLTYGVSTFLAWRAGDLTRTLPGLIALMTTGLLGLVGVIRYNGSLHNDLATWLILLVLVTLVGMGTTGVMFAPVTVP
ncbi:MAG TPA: hypothetical protein VL551_12485 [Actinospica sp.]|nr:hypothetical protein [Actinospica sp.]